MVRQSKIPEISLHQDNNKRLNSNLRLAHTGSISIFPTIEGGEYDVTTLQSVLNDPLYVHLQGDTLRVGSDSGVDTNIEPLDFIGLHATNEILIGTQDPEDPEDPEDLGVVGTVTFQSDEMIVDVNSTNFNIANDAIFSVAHLSGTNSINIGVDKDTNTISETTTINGDDVKITTPSGNIELNGNQIRMNGNVDINGEISFANADIVFQNGLSVLGGVSIFNLMNGNNNGSKNGIWFDEHGDHALYFVDNTGLAPSSGDANGVPVPIYDVNNDTSNDVKKIRLRTSSGLIFEDSATNTVFFSLDTTDSSNVYGELIGGLTIGGDINVSGNVTINGDLIGSGISISDNGTINTTGGIEAENITTQNVSCTGTLTTDNITSQSVVLSDNLTMEDSSGQEVFRMDSSGNLESSGTIQSTEFLTESVSIRTNLEDSGSEVARFDYNGLSLSGVGATIDAISTKEVTIKDDGGATRIIMDASGFVCNEDVTINGNALVNNDLTVHGNINYNNITLTGNLDCNELTANAFHTGDTNGNMEFNMETGIITAKNMFLSGSLDVSTIRTDATIIDTNGITCQNSVSAKEFHHVSTDINGNETIHPLIDSSGNLNLPGYISVDGDIETTGGKIIGVDADISGNIEANRIIIEENDGKLEIGNGYDFDSNDTGYDAVTIDSPCIISKDASNYSYLKAGEIVCGDNLGNNTKVTSNGIEIRDGSVVTSSILNSGIIAQNLTIEDTLTLSDSTTPLAVSSEIKIQGTDTSKLVTITPTDLSIENGTSKFNATSSALEFESPIGTRVAKMTTNEIEAPSLITDNLRVNNKLTFGDTLVITGAEDTYSVLTFQIDDVVFTDRTPTNAIDFGPEYNIVLRINRSGSFLACIVLSINFGNLLNGGVDYMCTGKLGNTYLNGSDSVKKITTLDDSIYQFNYERNLNVITIGGGEAGVEEDDVPDLGPISYTVHIAKGIGLGFVA
jgi:cytoskeletal protein CcmA (bactofilin family)